ncbi:MAG: response regulator [Verrucomicrobia subdivision 3 bacterium]|nr:response regulator [Limisphaerales bacterium]
MTPSEVLKVLLVEDDEDDYVLARTLFSEIKGSRYNLQWISSFEVGLEAMAADQHDVCLVDYRLGARNGIELLREAQAQGCRAPIILLTGQGEHEIDLEAMKAGAADYLVKGRLDAGLLERSIRYSLERKRASALAAAEQARLAAFGANVGLALTRRDSLDVILNDCAAAIVKYLNAVLARIWIYEPDERPLKLHASAGGIRDFANLKKLPSIAAESVASGKPILINQISETPPADQDWLQREGIVAFAGYPLMLEDRPVGLMSMFSCSPLSEATLQEMGSVAHGIALCIERKRSAEALGLSEFKYRSVVENIKEVIFQVNENGCWTFLNPAWTEITGFKLKDTLGTRVAEYVHPEDRERHWELFQQLIERKHSFFRDETRYLASDGTYRWVEVYAQPTLDSNLFGTSGTIRDITERKRAEAEIEKLAAFVRLNPDPVTELAADGTLTYMNPAAREMARSLGLVDPEAILPRDAAAVARECLRLGHSKPGQEISINGRTLSWSFFPIVASQVVHCYGSDVTERINLEQQLRHSQKLESIGQLAAGVAHDFNNILTIIQGHSDRLVAQCDGDDELCDPLQQISAAATRASSLTRQLLMFSRKQVIRSRVIDLNVVLGNLAKMLHRLLGDDIALETKYAPELPAIEADTGMIEQIIVNLVVNSRDAMPRGGQLLITTMAVQIDEAYAQQNTEAWAGRFVALSVTDTGCGMSKETLDRIFEPFFTTKEVGKGTGLGLATVYGIVKQHQGWIEVASELNIGTTFKIYFPVSDKPAEVLNDNPPPARVRGGHETILLVEDEPVLRELARLILGDYKYRVLEASTGSEALKIFEQNNGQIDLLLTDMVMPEGMTGRELAEELKRRKPDLRVIYTSGYSAEVMGKEPELKNVRFLQKPYPPPQLAQAVRECLDVR